MIKRIIGKIVLVVKLLPAYYDPSIRTHTAIYSRAAVRSGNNKHLLIMLMMNIMNVL